jgi:hypothetical protein
MPPRNIGWNIALRYALILLVVKQEREGPASDGWTGNLRGATAVGLCVLAFIDPQRTGFGAGQSNVLATLAHELSSRQWIG